MTNALRVLIVDDNRDLGDMLVEYLREVGLHAVAASSAEAALDLLRAESFEVLMTDVRLPGMSGIELATRAVAQWPRMGIVISSGYGDIFAGGYLPAVLEAAVEVVAKPCDLSALPGVLAKAVARSRQAHP